MNSNNIKVKASENLYVLYTWGATGKPTVGTTCFDIFFEYTNDDEENR